MPPAPPVDKDVISNLFLNPICVVFRRYNLFSLPEGMFLVNSELEESDEHTCSRDFNFQILENSKNI